MKYLEGSDEHTALSEALSRFEECQDYHSNNYIDARADVEFSLGLNQWEPKDKANRDKDGLPSLILNQMNPYCNQVINGIRQARPSIRVTPSDAGADSDTAEIYSGLIRNIELTSKAHDAYDKAAENAVRGGYGWIRIVVDYANDYTFDQEISIERILNFQSVYLDPSSQRLDGADAEYVFIFEDLDKKAFEKMYPDAQVEGINASVDGWVSKDKIRVAEYYKKHYEDMTIYRIEREEPVFDPMGIEQGTKTIEATVT